MYLTEGKFDDVISESIHSERLAIIMKNFYLKYKHGIPLILYGAFYIVWFAYLERTVTKNYRVIHLSLDDYIPFCELFVIPYFIWFLYASFPVIFLFLKDKGDYARVCIFYFVGMTTFLIISTLFPNGHHLRPAVMPRDNALTLLIKYLYSTDTSTNLWPSIHVYNSLGAHFAIAKSPYLSNKKWMVRSSFLICISIVLSTMFIKQHSIFDVVTAFILATVMYGIVYKYDIVTAYKERILARKKTAPQTN